MYATIDLDGRKIKHTIYVVKDDFPMEYEGILGIDFLQKQQVSCDYKKRELRIGDAVLKLLPYDKITLKPRSETIIQAATDRNEIGVIRAEETAPGIYIGRCLVEPENYSCPISVINTTDQIIEIRTPLVKIEDIDTDNPHAIYTIQLEKTRSHPSSRNKQI
ncbi:retrovirus-like pol polyprotein [Lasius niger]|uniref:Retrovirus-like pol polyprotein n=1 Tax=Lasius niger TaxID=67767 RepID=A0A0J7KQC1_LASNI|nr:retrovirus-like pol polyprotein [Lasius niger]